MSSFLFLLGASAQTGDPAKQPVAIVGGQPIYEEELLQSIQTQLRALERQEFELKNRALEKLIQQKLLQAEAKKKGLPVEKLLEQEVESHVTEPADAEVEAFYLARKDRVKRPFEEIKDQLRSALKQVRLQQARQGYLEQLRETAGVVVLLAPPRVEVSYDLARLRGKPDAPVVIVEFSDFQCPYCRRAAPTLREVLEKYQGRVSLAYRDFPLRELHPQAQAAAEAARCAGEQGKFWEYHDLLFADAKLDPAGLAESARSLGLDGQEFDSCLSSGKYRPAVEQDLQDGTKAGVSGTPAFFINGVFLGGAQPASAFEELIEAELAAAERKSAPHASQ